MTPLSSSIWLICLLSFLSFISLIIFHCCGGDSGNVNILVGTKNGVYMFNTSSVESVTTIANTTGWVSSVDYHLERHMVYFIYDHKLYRSDMTPKNASSYTLVKEMGECECFTVDWVHDVIYWINCSTNSLQLMDLDGNNVITVMTIPRGKMWFYKMEVDPQVGQLFWLANGTLEWCDLAGENYQTNLSDPSLNVHEIALDLPTRRLFYFGSTDTKLYQMSYNSDGTVGSTKRTIISLLDFLHSITVFGDYLYYSNIQLINRKLTTGVGRPEPIKSFEVVARMKVVDPKLQQPFSGDPCKDTDCSHFCVHQRGVAKCLCPDGMFLGNKMICSAKISGLLFVTTLLGLCLQLVLLVGLIAATFCFMLHVNGRYSSDWPDWIPWRD